MNPQPRTTEHVDLLWRHVAEQLRDEENPEKMLTLAVELNSLLELAEKLRKPTSH